ncbi:MAG: protein kinase [Anaerolineae bacterium]|nr:protein kinase [Anaerolineae bacterium]
MSKESQMQTLGKYEILEELGWGGFATVYRARDTVLGRNVALKILHPALLADPAFVARFENDARAAAQLDHPHIVTVYDLGQLEGRLYIAMKLLPGGTLADHIQREGPLPLAEAVRIVSEVAGALDHAHERGFVHRDVKPTNVLFDARGEAVVTDFGLVKAAEDSIVARSSAGGVVGTPAYIAPEVWEGKEAGAPADVYALGCLLFEMLTGEPMFQGDTSPAVMMAHFKPHEYPETWPEGVPPAVEGILERALAQDPADRYPRPGAFAGELQTLAGQAADPLAGTYQALQRSLATEAWPDALTLAQEILAADVDYRDVSTLRQRAAEGQARAERAQWAAQWREQALAAEQAGQVGAARVAAQHWLEMAPDDQAARALLSRLAAVPTEEPATRQPVVAQVEVVAPISPVVPQHQWTEEQPGVQPGAARRRSVPVWAWGVGVLVLVVLVGFAVLLGRGQGSPASLATDSPTSEITTTGVPSLATTPVATSAQPTLAPSLIATLSVAEAQATLAALGVEDCGDYEDVEDFESAAECLRLVTIAEPENFWAYNNLARVYQLLDEWELALDAAQDGLAVATTPEDQVEAYFRIGVTHHRMGDYESAIDSLSTASRIPRSVPAYDTNLQVWLAWSYQANGQMEEACAHFQEALDLAVQQDYTWAINHAQEGLEKCESIGISITALPVLEGTPVPRPRLAISAATASQVTELARWGKGTVMEASYSPDGELLAVSSSLGTYLYDAQTLTEVRLIEDLTSAVFSPDGSLLALWNFYDAYDDTLEVRQVSDGSLVHAFSMEGSYGPQAFSPDGTLLAVGLDNAEVKIWRIADGSSLKMPGAQADQGYAYSLAFSPDGKLLASGSSDNLVRIWNIADGTLLYTLAGHTDSVSAVTFSPDGETVISVSWDGTAKEWQVADGALLRSVEISMPRSGVTQLYDVELSPDGEKLAIAGGIDAQVLNSANWQSLYSIDAHTSNVDSISFSPDGRTLASASHDGTTRLWQVSDGAYVDTLEGFMGSLLGLGLSADGETVSVADTGYTVRLWDTWSGERLKTLPLPYFNARSLALAPDGATFALGSAQGVIRLRSAGDGSLLQEFEGHTYIVDNLTFSPDGTMLASGSYDNTARLWRVSDGKLLHTFEGHADKVASVAFSPDGQWLATGSWDETVRLWRVSDGALLHVLEGHESRVQCVAFSPDGQTLASGGGDGVRLWYASTGRPLDTIAADGNELAFSPDGSVLVADQSLLRVSDGLLLGKLTSTGRIEGMTFTPDGMLLVTADQHGTVRLWGVPPD